MSIATHIRKLLADGVSGNQGQLVVFLKQKGIVTTQSSVSRALKKIKAVKTQDDNGNIIYSLPQSGDKPLRPSFFGPLVKKITDNTQLVVIHTRAGAAGTVAKSIDDDPIDGILGSVAGDDTIIIVPEKPGRASDIARLLENHLRRVGLF